MTNSRIFLKQLPNITSKSPVMLKNLLMLCFCLLVFPLLAFQAGDDWKAKISPGLKAQMAAGSTVLDAVVLLDEQADLAVASTFNTKLEKGEFALGQLQRTARMTQQPLLAIIDNHNAFHQSFYVVNAIRVKGQPDLLRKLAQHPSTRNIIANSPYRMQPLPVEENAARLRETTWGIQMINADDVWELGYTGEGVVVGGQDTGYDWTHPALITKYRGYIDENTVDHNYSWHDAIYEIDSLHNDSIIAPSNNPCGLQVDYPCDDHSHGTHTMGTMVGSDAENEIGVAPGAQWIGCRNMERGWGSPASYIECFEWMMAPTDLNGQNPNPAMAPVAFANSWGCPPIEGCDTSNFHIMEMVVNNVKNSGVVVVVSAGNSGSSCSTVSNPAAIFENSFTVGSTRSNDTISGFSSRGPVLVDGSGRMKPDIAAPGSNVYSSVLNGGYASSSGTSMAGPHVVGVIALMVDANPDLAGQVDLIENIIKASAVPKTTDQDCGDIAGTEVPNNTYGHGRINALAAVEMALETTTGVAETSLSNQLNVFPNPFLERLNFNLPNITGPTDFRMFNATGQLVFQAHWQLDRAYLMQTVALPILPNGVYFYKIENEKETLQGKVLRNGL